MMCALCIGGEKQILERPTGPLLWGEIVDILELRVRQIDEPEELDLKFIPWSPPVLKLFNER